MRIGYKDVTGIDITEIEVKKLKENFPQYKIIQKGISDDSKLNDFCNFDIITCFDVLFHIVDNNKYRSALENINNYLKPEGYLILSENYVFKKKDRTHIIDRKAREIESLLSSSGFKILEEIPVFFSLNPPMRSGNKLLWKLSDRRIKLLKQLNSKGYYSVCNLIGMFFYFVDSVLHKTSIKGMGTKILICQKINL